ncbi:Os11g0109050, partial [Oryza sativa Japonica Group]
RFPATKATVINQSINPRLVVFLQRRRPPPPAQHGAHPRQPHHRVHPSHPLQSSPYIRPLLRLAAAAAQDLSEAARERHGLRRFRVPGGALRRRR